jgi:hypothetical protein
MDFLRIFTVFAGRAFGFSETEGNDRAYLLNERKE